MSSTHTLPPLSAEYRPLESPLLENPYPFYARARAECPVFFSEAVNAWVVTRYEDIRSILVRPEVFSSANVLRPLREHAPEAAAILKTGYPRTGKTLTTSDGVDHKRRRAGYNVPFSPGRIAPMRGTIGGICERLVDAFADAGTVDIIAALARPLPLEVVLTMCGVPREMMDTCKQWTDDWTALVFGQESPERQVECAHSTVAFQRYCAQLVKGRRENPRDDVISHMIQTRHRDARPLDDVDLVNALFGLVVAGHATTTHLIGNALIHLLSRPGLWEAIAADPDRIPAAVEEVLRFDAPAQSFYRITTNEVVVGEVTLPPGADVLLLYGSANHDERAFEHADEFDIDRKPNPHLAFGHGPHKCAGMHLARLEGQVSLEVLSRRFPRLRLVEDGPREYVRDRHFHGVAALLVEWDA